MVNTMLIAAVVIFVYVNLVHLLAHHPASRRHRVEVRRCGGTGLRPADLELPFLPAARIPRRYWIRRSIHSRGMDLQEPRSACHASGK